ncbi:transposase [Actinoplanes sp. NPDC051411]|uniref:transposase n=1 Tax=Actinoplanes sp. NPDC051411 TaxID=3155522 RepID=UPI003435BF0E
MLVRDRLSLHKTPTTRAAIAARPWPRVYELPAYAPELNPVDNVWPTIKGSLANLAVNDLTTAVKNRLKRMQYRTAPIDGYFTATALPPPAPP